MTSLLIGILFGVAQAAAPQTGSSRPWVITDNSFLVEEAFNQEPKIYQNIFNWSRTRDVWQMTFTQEWPVPAIRHQLSYTLVYSGVDNVDRFGDMLANYRLQVLEEGPGRPAFSPRVSLILPTGSRDIGAHQTGVQVNLPFSKQDKDFYFHWNAGFTWLPEAKAAGTGDAHANLMSPFLAGSTIYRLRPMINLMLEHLVIFNQSFDGVETSRATLYTLSPGVRGGWNVGEGQIILGLAAPTTWGGGETDTGLFLYFSYELPFKDTKKGGQAP